jgi:hypothetical protein
LVASPVLTLAHVPAADVPVAAVEAEGPIPLPSLLSGRVIEVIRIQGPRELVITQTELEIRILEEVLRDGSCQSIVSKADIDELRSGGEIRWQGACETVA